MDNCLKTGYELLIPGQQEKYTILDVVIVIGVSVSVEFFNKIFHLKHKAVPCILCILPECLLQFWVYNPCMASCNRH